MSYNQYGNPYGDSYKYGTPNQSSSNYHNYGPPSAPSYAQYAQSPYQPPHQLQQPQPQQQSQQYHQYNQHPPYAQPSTSQTHLTAQPYSHHQQQAAQSYGQYQAQSYAPSPQFAPSPGYGPPSLTAQPSPVQSYHPYAKQSNGYAHHHVTHAADDTSNKYGAWRAGSFSNGQHQSSPHVAHQASPAHPTGAYVSQSPSFTQYHNSSNAMHDHVRASPLPAANTIPTVPKQAVTTLPSPSSFAAPLSVAHSPATMASAHTFQSMPSPLSHTSASQSPYVQQSAIVTEASTARATVPAEPRPANTVSVQPPKARVNQSLNSAESTAKNVIQHQVDANMATSMLQLEQITPQHRQTSKGQAAAVKPPEPQVISDLGRATDSQRSSSKKVEETAYDMLLISMSDEYISAAYTLGPRVALLGGKAELEMYNGLIAAGLCCLEAALKNFSFPARLEAAITFRYATIMFEETENSEQLEKVISKGILRCDRGRLLDAKYSFYHLLARSSFRRNPKAALRALDTHIDEVEGHKNVPWIYALRLLRITLSLQTATNHDLTTALQHLTSLIDLADRNRDFGMIVTLATLEALVHLRTKSSDHVMNCQEAIAKARSLQMRQGAVELRQVWALLSCIDLACGMLECNAKEIRAKVRETQDRIEELVLNSQIWTNDGTIAIALGELSTKQIVDYTSGIFDLDTDGQAVITIQWLDSPGAYAFGYLLGGIAGVFRNAIDDKNFQYITGGLDVLNTELTGKNIASASPTSRAMVQECSDRNVNLQWHFRLYEALLFCIKTKWKQARKVLQQLQKAVDQWSFRNEDILRRWIKYLHGMIEQGTGNFEVAADDYRAVIASPKTSTSTALSGQSSSEDDLAVLSRINLLFLLRSAEHAPTTEAQQLLLELEELVPSSHPNAALRTAVALISAVLNPREAMTKTKSALRTALQVSRASGNAQLLAMSMTAMVSIFFTDITVGDQAQQARSVALELTGRAGDPLWVAVANGMALQGELDTAKIAQRHKELDKAIDAMDEGARSVFLLAQVKDEAAG